MPLILRNTVILHSTEEKKSTNYDMPLIVRPILISECQNVGKNMHLRTVDISCKKAIIIILDGAWHMVLVQRGMDLARYTEGDQQGK